MSVSATTPVAGWSANARPSGVQMQSDGLPSTTTAAVRTMRICSKRLSCIGVPRELCPQPDEATTAAGAESSGDCGAGCRPLAIDLFCGLGGWTDGLLAEGYDVIGFDIEQHVYGEHRYPGMLAIQDVRTLHGSQFKNADLIVASPPCQEYSYMAMPWKRAKALAAEYRRGVRDVKQLTALFDACFRIQREASEAAGRHIPMVVENVRGAEDWVGRARWKYGSFYLWGDVPALMPPRVGGLKSKGLNWSDQTKRGQDFTRHAGRHAMEGIKCGGDWFGPGEKSAMRNHSSKSPARKAASAMIAKIPLPLSRHIAAAFRPAHIHSLPPAATERRASPYAGSTAAALPPIGAAAPNPREVG